MNRKLLFTENRFTRTSLVSLLLLMGSVLLSCSRSIGQEKEKELFQGVRVLLVSGEDHPGHPWKSTGPKLRDILEKNPAICVRIAEDIDVIGTDLLFQYDVLFLHFKDYSPLQRENEIKTNLKTFLQKGGGLVLYHFSCGSFQDWSQFVEIAGRVWDPKKRGHDPFGTFEVEMVDSEHPITKGISTFSITDELYTCLSEGPPIHLLAQARSKVDGLFYPMAFVLEYEKGRVFHTLLGHDTKALESAEFQQMLKNAILWVGHVD